MASRLPGLTRTEATFRSENPRVHPERTVVSLSAHQLAGRCLLAGFIANPPVEPGTRAPEQVQLVIALDEPVSLTWVDHEFVLGPVPAERTVEVDRLADRHVGVVLAVHDQHRGTDLRRKRDRAHLVVRVRAAALPAAAAAERGFQGCPFAGRDEHPPVADPGDHDRGLEPVGLPDRPGGHEPAMAGTTGSAPARCRAPLRE